MGVPEMTGARLRASTVMPNAGSDTVESPSLTLITTPEKLPAALGAGVPCSVPVRVENDAHDGLPAIEKVSFLRSGSEARGVKEYDWPTLTRLAGVPVIVGLRLRDVTLIEKGGNATDDLPSLTLISMPGYVPTACGVPLSTPVDLANVAQAGLFLME
jgi:hypothetical protein